MTDQPPNCDRGTNRVLHAVSVVAIVSVAIAAHAGGVAARFVLTERQTFGRGRLRADASFSGLLARGRPVADYALALATVVIVAIASRGYTTSKRNRKYASDPGMWEDMRSKRSGNERAVTNHGLALIASGRLAEALPMLREAVARRPDSGDARNGLGFGHSRRREWDDAIDRVEQALQDSGEQP